ncbi:Translin [Xylariaceae sp. FL0804]|nr:Translin [Xylariaceae sp. FL0804]
MSDITVPERRARNMGGVKRDYHGKEKMQTVRDAPRNQYTSMFEAFRDELDEHHDRRMRIGKVSRDVTALAKKVIFSLQRVRKLGHPLPEGITSEADERLREIGALLATIAADVAGMNRHRYNLPCLEELVEAVAFAHYLRTQTLMTPVQAGAAVPTADGAPAVELTAADYAGGVFDLTGEMMRFATAVTALSGRMPGGSHHHQQARGESKEASTQQGQQQQQKEGKVAEEKRGEGGAKKKEGDESRTILADMQDVSSMLHICPPLGGGRTYGKKQGVMVEQVRKVERLGYGVIVRGNERPKGWMPDLNEARGGGEPDDVVME